VTILIFAYQGHSLLTISAVVVVAAILNGFSTYFITLKYIPWFGAQRPTKAQFIGFIGFSGWVLVWSLVAKGLLVTELLLLGYLIGAELVTSYVFSTYVTQLGLAVALMTGTAITPSLGRLLGSKNYEESQPLIIIFRKINLLIAVVVGGGVLLFNKAFVGLWVGHEFYLGDKVNLLIVIAFVQLVLLRGEAQVQDLSLNIKRKVLIGILSSFFSVLFAIYFYHYFDNDVSALFIGVILGRLIMSLMFPIMVNTYCQINQLLLKQYSMGGAILIVCYYLSEYIFVNTWLSFLGVLFLCGCGLFVISYTLLFGVNPKELLHKWF
jgi:O-antigen/teichoic acid export membrane protein